MNLILHLVVPPCLAAFVSVYFSLALFLSLSRYGWWTMGGLWINSFDKWEEIWPWLWRISHITAGLRANWLSVYVCVYVPILLTDKHRVTENQTDRLYCLIVKLWAGADTVPNPSGYHCPVVTIQQWRMTISSFFVQITIITLVYSQYSELFLSCSPFTLAGAKSPQIIKDERCSPLCNCFVKQYMYISTLLCGT